MHNITDRYTPQKASSGATVLNSFHQPEMLHGCCPMRLLALHLALSFFLLLVFISGSFAFPAKAKAADTGEKLHILLLHSYHPNMLWVQDISTGVQEIIEPVVDASNGNVRLSIDYLDAKRYPEEEHLVDMLRFLRKKYTLHPPEVIITADNIALDLLLKHRKEFAQSSIVFCGYNYYTPEMLKGHENVTGIVEAVSIDDTLQAAFSMLPELSRIVAISDRSQTGQALIEDFNRQVITLPQRGRLELWSNYTFDSLQHDLANLDSGSAILLMSALQDTEQKVRTYRQSLNKILEATDRPVFAIFGFFAGRGIVGGKLTDGVEQGRQAATMALRIARGGNAADIPVITVSPNNYIYDYNKLQQYSIELANVPADSIILNEPPTFYQRYRKILLPMFVLVSLLTLALALESRHIIKQRAVEQSLREAKTRYRELVDNARSIILHISTDGTIEFINEYGLSFFGYSEGELDGKKIHGTLLPDSSNALPDLHNLINRILEHPEIYQSHENENTCKNGDKVWVSWLNKPIVSEDGEVVGLLSAGQDATARKKIQDALARRERSYAVLLSNLPGMAFRRRGDDLGTILFASEGCLQLTGYSPARLCDNIGYWALIHPADLHKVQNAAMAFPQRYAVEYRIVQAGGSVRWVWESGTCMTETNEPQSVECRPGDVIEGFATDITDRVTTRNELEKLNEELEERVRERTAELKESLERLQQAQSQLVQTEKMAALGGLVAGVAHEINTPIGIGVTSTSFLQEKIQQLEAQYASGKMRRSDIESFLRTGNESLAATQINLNRAAELIRSFKQVAVDQSEEMPRKFNVSEYLEEVLVSLRPRYKRTAHTVKVEGDKEATIISYPGVFMQIVTNILTNALLHGFENVEKGTLTISIHMTEAELKLVLQDDGNGMPPEVRDKIFEPFFSTKRGKGGTGLGMHIVYNLVTQRLGGTITCDSAPGAGTSFTIVIPISGNNHAA
ncbi:ATP-binding protein [Oleidesulfovibrio sp.]|uniref:ATP-binding protein n=1 Tax=Oleidesulfovibrio sp. TaxID=2909707 RepID=UPI003A83732E